MSRLAVAMEAVADAVAACLPDWSSHVGFRLSVQTPAFIVGLPVALEYSFGPRDTAKVTLPVTGVVATEDANRLVDFLTPDGLAEALQGASNKGAWLGQLLVQSGEDIRLAPNGEGAQCLAADITVELLV